MKIFVGARGFMLQFQRLGSRPRRVLTVSCGKPPRSANV